MKLIAGLDEVGMGCIAGPVVVVVAAFDQEKQSLEGVKDSKILSEKKRVELFDPILDYADYFGFGYADVLEIDQLGIAMAWQLAARRALLNCPKFEILIIDGVRKVNSFAGSQKTVIKGDALHWQVSAASILAKVLRDREMISLHQLIPCYGWNRNVGYGTKEHYTALRSFGLSLHHRKSFLKKLTLPLQLTADS